MIEAAGGVIWRVSTKQALKVLLVHRPRYDDWSLPKGKLKAGEDPLAGALREVLEETGLVCEPGVELLTTRYIDRRGRAKRVRYWAMEPVSGRFVPNREVDEIRWAHLDDAAAALSYDRDIDVLAALRDVLVPLARRSFSSRAAARRSTSTGMNVRTLAALSDASASATVSSTMPSG